MKDSQKSKALTALEFADVHIDHRLFSSIEEAQVYLDQRIRTPWFQRRWPGVAQLGMVVKPFSGSSGANKDNWEDTVLRRMKYKTAMFPIVNVPVHRLDALTLWHVVAHNLTGANHGREWAGTMLVLVGKYMGRDARLKLRDKFRSDGVKFHKKRNISDDRRQELSKRAKDNPRGWHKKLTGDDGMSYGGGGA